MSHPSLILLLNKSYYQVIYKYNFAKSEDYSILISGWWLPKGGVQT